MRSTIYILIATVVLTSFGCDKLKSTYTMEGFLYYSCSKDPVVQAPLELIYKRGGFSGGGSFDVTTTDDKGYFKFEYKPKSGAQMYILPGKGYGGGIVRQIPLEPYIDLGEVFMSEAGQLVISLTAMNAYSDQDTLYVAVGAHKDFYPDPALIIPGPFTSGIIDQLEIAKSFIYFNIYGTIGSGPIEWWINASNTDDREKKRFDLHGCGVVDSVSIEI